MRAKRDACLWSGAVNLRHYLKMCISLITERAATTVKPETTMTKRIHKFTSKPKPTKLPDLIIKKTLSIYHKVVYHTMKHLGLVIFGAIVLGLMSLIILVCMCR